MRINIDELMYKKNCPICGSEMHDITPGFFVKKTWACRNKCYVFTKPLKSYSEHLKYEIYVFEYYITFDPDSPNFNFSTIEEIEYRVRYWKKDERYLTKLMEN